MKRCPRCGERLADVLVGGVRVDGCSGCGGVWFNNTELGAVANANPVDLLALEDKFLPGPSSPSTAGAISCPECQAGMYTFSYPHAPDVRLDACPECKGIWADDGELYALYSAMTGALAAKTAPDPRRAARQALNIFMARRCSGCGTINTSSSQLCRGCSAKLDTRGQILCPNCDAVLRPRELGSLILEMCAECTGVWLNPGELSLLAHYRPEELRRFQDDATVKPSGASVMWKANPTLFCPRCCVGMVLPEHTLETGVRLDLCEKCDGIWIGAGQLPTVSRHYTDSLTRRTPLT